MVTTAGATTRRIAAEPGLFVTVCIWGLRGGFQGDLESLGLEFGDEAVSLLLGVDAGGEAVGAEIVISAAGGEHAPEDDDELCATATIAFFLAAGLRNPPNLRTRWR
jgi:hypothetical protein